MGSTESNQEYEEYQYQSGAETAEGASWDGALAAASAAPDGDAPPKESNLLCPYFMAKGECRFAEACTYTHGDMCDMCGIHILHPVDEKQREEHMKVSLPGPSPPLLLAGAASNIIFVATKKRVLLGAASNIIFVATKNVFCCDKHVFVMTKHVLS